MSITSSKVLSLNCTIRPETREDHAVIHALTEAAFREAPHSSHTEQFIVDALRSRGELSLSLVAEKDGQVVGHIALSPVTISDGSTGWFGLGPISVLPDWQGQGIGAALMHAALGALREQNAQGCVLLGGARLLRSIRIPRRAGPGAAGCAARVLPGAVPAATDGAGRGAVLAGIRGHGLMIGAGLEHPSNVSRCTGDGSGDTGGPANPAVNVRFRRSPCAGRSRRPARSVR